MLLSSLLNKEVVTESGWAMGHVFDVRVEVGGGTPRVDGLVVGKQGVRERLAGTIGGQESDVLPQSTIPWDAVIRLEKRRLVVREVPEPN